MRRHRFHLDSGSLRGGRGARVRLPAEEARHLLRSLRGRAGMIVHLFDGEGEEWTAEVVFTGSRSEPTVEAVLLDRETLPVEPALEVVLLQALSRDFRFEQVVDHGTALGVAAFVPLRVDRAVPGPHGARSEGSVETGNEKRLSRWRRVAREAAKLSGRRLVPRIGSPVDIAGSPAPRPPSVRGILLDPGSPAGSLRVELARERPETVLLAAGPEGGFSEEETSLFIARGFTPVSLGPRVLRTEQAGPAAIAIVLSAWGDLG